MPFATAGRWKQPKYPATGARERSARRMRTLSAFRRKKEGAAPMTCTLKSFTPQAEGRKTPSRGEHMLEASPGHPGQNGLYRQKADREAVETVMRCSTRTVERSVNWTTFRIVPLFLDWKSLTYHIVNHIMEYWLGLKNHQKKKREESKK